MASAANVHPPIFDSKIVATPADLPGVQQTYVKSSFEKVSTTSGNPQLWGPGSTLTYQTPQFYDSVWDLNETYLEMKAKIHVTFTDTPEVGSPANYELPLSGYATAALEKYFLSGLCEQINVSYGDSEIKSFEGPPFCFPTLHALYTTVNSENDKVLGEAAPLNLARVANFASAREDVKAGYSEARAWNVIEDASRPYNICQSCDEGSHFLLRSDDTSLPFDCQANVANFEYWKAKISGNGHQYRSMLILDPQNVTPGIGPGAPGVPNPAYRDGSQRMLMKFKHPFFEKNETGFKTPANLPIRVTLRKSRDISYVLMGDALTDVILSTGAGYTSATNATYRLVIEELDFYFKRLVLSETARTVLYQSPSIIWSQPIFQSHEFDLTSNTLQIPVANVKAPECVWVALMPKASLRPPQLPAGENLQKLVSVYNTSKRSEIAWQSLYLNTAKGQIPEYRYELAQDSGSVNIAHSMRAYEEFKKSMKYQREQCIIPFRTWVNGYQWFAFIINNDDANPHDETNQSERSNVVINAVLQMPPGANEVDTRAAHSLVVVTMESGLVVNDNLKSVSVLY